MAWTNSFVRATGIEVFDIWDLSLLINKLHENFAKKQCYKVCGREMNNKIKAIFFNFGGTLDSDGITYKDRFYPFYLDMGINVSQEEFGHAFYNSDDSILTEKLDDLSFRETLRLQVGRVLQGLKVDNKFLQYRIADRFLQNSLSKLEENRKVLECLKKNYLLGIISNFFGNLPEIIREVGMEKLFDVIIDSSRVGYFKPDPKIFYEALKPLKLSPHQAIYVGESLNRDMAGARGVGMPHIWLKNQKSASQSLCCPEDKTINQLSDLMELIPEIKCEVENV